MIGGRHRDQTTTPSNLFTLNFYCEVTTCYRSATLAWFARYPHENSGGDFFVESNHQPHESGIAATPRKKLVFSPTPGPNHQKFIIARIAIL